MKDLPIILCIIVLSVFSIALFLFSWESDVEAYVVTVSSNEKVYVSDFAVLKEDQNDCEGGFTISDTGKKIILIQKNNSFFSKRWDSAKKLEVALFSEDQNGKLKIVKFFTAIPTYKGNSPFSGQEIAPSEEMKYEIPIERECVYKSYLDYEGNPRQRGDFEDLKLSYENAKFVAVLNGGRYNQNTPEIEKSIITKIPLN